jgi:hypothetical protein
MGTFSRWMPVAPQPAPRRRDWVVITAAATVPIAGLAWALYLHPWVWLLVLAAVALVTYGSYSYTRQLRQLAATRAAEDISTFARAFDRRGEPFDPWVARAVWDALQAHLRVDGKPVPIRPSDRIVEDLKLDWEDLEFDIVSDIAPRARRSLDGVEQNPLYGQLNTVGDLVRLLSSQPPRAAA